MLNLRLLGTGAALVMAATVLVGGTTSATAATDPTPLPTTQAQPQYAGPVEYQAGTDVYDTGGRFQYSRVYDAQTMGTDVNPLNVVPPRKPGKPGTVTPAGSDSGYGGTSSASGCQRAWVDVWQKSLTGLATLYKWRIWTYWCWNRANHNIYDVSTGWRILDNDGSVEWVQEINVERNYFAWISGYPRSGYNHFRQHEFKSCPFPFIPCDYYYPSARLHAHSNGTWRWWGSW